MKTILHLSDIHSSVIPQKGQQENDISEMVDALIADMAGLPRPDTIFITGDISNSGLQDEFSIFDRLVIDRLVKELKISKSRIFITPGNHDANRKLWRAADNLWRKSLTSNADQTDIESILQEQINENGVPWLESYRTYASQMAVDGESKRLQENVVFSSWELDGVGIGVLNSAWLSTGDDEKKLIVGRWQLREVLSSISAYAEKIILMHHPLDWLHPNDKSEISDLIYSSGVRLLLYGHMHSFGMCQETHFSESPILKLQGGKFDKRGNDRFIGYSIINFDLDNVPGAGNVHFRKYSAGVGRFVEWVDRAPQGMIKYSLGNASYFDLDGFAKLSKEKVEQLEYDLLCNTGMSQGAQKKLSDIFVCPNIFVQSEKGETVDLDKTNKKIPKFGKALTYDDFIHAGQSTMVFGGENSGKTILAKKLLVDLLKEQGAKNIERIVYYFDAKQRQVKKESQLLNELVNFYISGDHVFASADALRDRVQSGSAVVLIDSIECMDKAGIRLLLNFANNNPSLTMYIFGQLSVEPLINSMIIESSLGRKYRKVSVKGFKRSQVRELFSRWNQHAERVPSKAVSQALKVVSGAGMPNNPFVYTMLFAIQERKLSSAQSYMHETDLVENFVEIILQKHVPVIDNSPQYKDILLFLGGLAEQMQMLDKYIFSENEIIEFALEFNQLIFQRFSVNSYINPARESGILIKKGDGIGFSQVCFFNYAYANWISKKGEPYVDLARSMDFRRFDKVVEYVAAIKKSDLGLLDFVAQMVDVAWKDVEHNDDVANLDSVGKEISLCVQHDLVDMIDHSDLNDAIGVDCGTQEDMDEKLDSVAPLDEEAVSDVSNSKSYDVPSIGFYEALSLYARVFRAAEHILDAKATSKHFGDIYKYYMKAASYSVRVFDKKTRPKIVETIAKILEFDKLDANKKIAANTQINAYINFTVSIIPNFTVSMMNSDFINQRQRSRLEKFRDGLPFSLDRLLLTYCLCELEDVDVIKELKTHQYREVFESSSLLIKAMELIFFNFSITNSQKDELRKFVSKILADRKSKQLMSNFAVISEKVVEKATEL